MTTNTNAALIQAERLLRRDAESLREGHTSHRNRDDWTGEDDARAGYEEYIAAADALAAISAAAAQPDALRAHAEGRIHHLNRGQCPDSVAGHGSRDPDCPICQALNATAALTTAAAVPPEGFVMVPKVPDERMERAIAAAFFGTVHEARKAWVAGIAAAPKAEPVQTDHFPDAKKMVAQPAGEYPTLPLAITSAPERIWLDLGFNPYEEDAHFSNLHDLTWSKDNATGDGIEYVRVDLTSAPKAEPVPAGEYPPLPTPDLGMPWRVNAKSDGAAHSSGFTDSQMRAYGEACWKHAYKHAAWAQAAPAAATHIQQPYGLAEIKAKIASNDYSAELLLQHAMLLEKPAAVAGPSQETCQTCQGNGEVVTDWERYKHPLPGDVGDEAVAECQDCDGQGTVDAAPTTQAEPQQEPVAWRHSKTLCLYETKAEVPLADGDEWAEPLYLAAPQPAAREVVLMPNYDLDGVEWILMQQVLVKLGVPTGEVGELKNNVPRFFNSVLHAVAAQPQQAVPVAEGDAETAINLAMKMGETFRALRRVVNLLLEARSNLGPEDHELRDKIDQLLLSDARSQAKEGA